MISVIIPVYNIEKYLPQCLDSMINQTYKDIEIILIDDGSTDKSGAICCEYAKIDSRIKVIHKENGGVSSARNVGILAARGEYISFVDGDDTADRDMFECLISNARKHNVDISCCGLIQIKLNGTIDNQFCNNETEYITSKQELFQNFFTNPIYREVLYGPYNKIFRADIVKETMFNENFAIAEDLLFCFECIEKSNSFFFENKGLYHYIRRENSATTSVFTEKRFDYIYVADILLKKCQEHYINVYPSALLWTYIHKLNICRSLSICTDIKKQNSLFYKNCKQFCKQHKADVWKKLSTKSKVMYYILRYFPFLFKVLSKI